MNIELLVLEKVVKKKGEKAVVKPPTKSKDWKQNWPFFLATGAKGIAKFYIVHQHPPNPFPLLQNPPFVQPFLELCLGSHFVPWFYGPLCGQMYLFSQVKCFRGNQDLVVDHLVRVLNIISDNWSLCQIWCAFKAFCNCVCEDICLDKARDKMLHECMLEYAHSVTRCYTGVTWCAWNVTCRYIGLTGCANNVTWRPIAKLCVYLVRTDFFEKLSM